MIMEGKKFEYHKRKSLVVLLDRKIGIRMDGYEMVLTIRDYY